MITFQILGSFLAYGSTLNRIEIDSDDKTLTIDFYEGRNIAVKVAFWIEMNDWEVSSDVLNLTEEMIAKAISQEKTYIDLYGEVETIATKYGRNINNVVVSTGSDEQD